MTFIKQHEQKLVCLLLALFIGFNILTGPYSPDPWSDEVTYSDPAVTLALEGHLASTAWGDQGVPVWTGNVPLHQLLLAGFVKVFGFSCRTVRSVNGIYYAIAVFLIYRMVRSYGVIRGPGLRLLLVIVLLSGTGLVAVYRNGRYDAIGLLVVIFWAWCSLWSRRKPAMLAGTFLAAVLMPAASLSIAPLLMLCGLIAFLLWRWQTVYALAITGAGCLAGMAIMQLVYARHGVPHIFHEVMKSAGGRDVAFDFVLSVFKNPSYIAAVIGGCLLSFPIRYENPAEDRSRKNLAKAFFSAAVIVPVLMAVVAKYHLYYSWMAIIPGSICAFMAVEFQSVPRLARMAVVLLMLAATLPGLPRRGVRVLGGWLQHRPEMIAQAALKNVSRSDVVFVDESSVVVYYALRAYAREVFWVGPPAKEAERASTTVVFWPQEKAEQEIHKLLGGEWRQVDHYELRPEKLKIVAEPPLQFAVYRKIELVNVP